MRITDGTPYWTEVRKLIVEYAEAQGLDFTFQNLEAEQTHDQDGKHTKKNHREKKQPRCDQSLRQIRDIFPEIFKHGQCAPF